MLLHRSFFNNSAFHFEAISIGVQFGTFHAVRSKQRWLAREKAREESREKAREGHLLVSFVILSCQNRESLVISRVTNKMELMEFTNKTGPEFYTGTITIKVGKVTPFLY